MKVFSSSSVKFAFSGVLTCCHGCPYMYMFPFWAAFLLAWCGQYPGDESRMTDSESCCLAMWRQEAQPGK